MPDSKSTKMVKVLCAFKAWGVIEGTTTIWYDAVMITVARSSEIDEAFRWEMQRRSRLYDRYWVHPNPHSFELVSFLPENGARVFDQTFALKNQEIKLCQKSGGSSL